jgi:guanine deaminase
MRQISFVKSLHPEHETYGDVYEQYGLLNNQTIMAHGVHLTDKEIASFVRNKSMIATFLMSYHFIYLQLVSHIARCRICR